MQPPPKRTGHSVACGCAPESEFFFFLKDFFGGALYDEASREAVPGAAVEASLGCGVPTAVADLHDGETVLDLGSGAGADVLISARRVDAERPRDRARHDRRDAQAGARERARGGRGGMWSS